MLLLLILSSLTLPTLAESTPAGEKAEAAPAPVQDSLNLNCKSAILIEASTGRVLYEQNANEALPPASVTKVMTLLLVMEAIDEGRIKLTDTVTASERAASMGGSQIFLKVGEQMSVEDMVKSVVIASANDAACALAEFVSGSEEAFVKAMNDRAKELGMENTNFENTNGLDDTAENHVTSARDIAIMSAELIKHETILKYSSIWMDTVRDGAFGLTNTNRLVRFYKGCTGLKTGSTSKAGFCVSATAERDGMHLVCVIMGAETRDIRNAEAKKLLDFGFANYGVFEHMPKELESLKITGGVADSLPIKYDAFSCVTDKSNVGKIECEIVLPESVSAPVKKGDTVGEVVFTLNGKEIGKTAVYSDSDVERIGFFGVWWRLLGKFLLK
ncbi:MAG: D-alanyl-D-alanine carboxypeptidase [Clostridia bacterium]|nr:D-alanyl-D-alanine carboxypeptidase [Clostridia bacterium]